jgi:hypothetical protein
LTIVSRNCTSNWSARVKDGIESALAAPAEELRAVLAQEAGKCEPVALTVWEGPMPESNGKSNFTVILHKGDLTEGICVYRSEYPDRARYEADCFRHIIGDPAFPEKPFICEYDADKHSGYVKPDTSPPAPVSVVLDENVEFEKWWLRTPVLRKGKLQIAQEAWEARASLDKVKEPNQ